VHTPYRVVFVCLGNICRSPMAEAVLRSLVADAGLDDRVEVSSAGTGDWHIGESADARALTALSRHGYDGAGHRARQFGRDWFDEHDLVVALDRHNAATLRRMAPAGAAGKVRLLRSFDPAATGPDVPDPYYGDDAAFDSVLAMVETACRALLAEVTATIGS
jgi:protein-tyrosine phosphatase